MNISKKIKAIKWGYILLSAAVCALGVFTVMNPDISALWYCRTAGIFMVAFGIVKVIAYCSNRLYRLVFQHDLAQGLLNIALGVVLNAYTSPMIAVLCTILGCYTMSDALLKVQIAVEAKLFGLRKWWTILLSALLTGAAGVVLVVSPFESAEALMILLGVNLIAEGIMNIVTIVTAARLVREHVSVTVEEI